MSKATIKLDTLDSILSTGDRRSTAEAILSCYRQAVAGDSFSIILVDLATSTTEAFLHGEGWLESGHRFSRAARGEFGLHPVALSLFAQRRPQALARSQVLSNSSWKKSGFYNEVDRPYGIEDTATIFLFTGDNAALALTCGRGRTFSSRSLETVESLARVLCGLKRFRDCEPSRTASEVCTSLDTLTTRESEVLHWVREGKRNSEIALILGISAHTVHHHLEKIFAKLGVETRTAAAAFTATAKSLDEGGRQVL